MNAVYTSPVTANGDVRSVARVAWPLVVSMLSYTVNSVIDILFVSSLGMDAVGAVGLAMTAGFAITCFGIGLLNGIKVLTAQAVGAGDDPRVSRLLEHGLVVALALGLVTMLLRFVSSPLLAFMSGEAEVGALAASYFETRLLGVVPLFIGAASFAWLEGQGDTRASMRVLVVANVLNVLLDVVLIFGLGPIPELGVQGAAAAAALTHTFQGVVGLLLVARRRRKMPTPITRPEAAMAKEVLHVGLPMGVQWSLEVMSFALFATFISHAGKAHIAAHTIAVRLVSLSFLPGHALGEAACILVGQAVGAGNPALARRAVRSATRFAVGVMGALGLVFLLAGGPILGLFKPSAAVLALATQLLVIAAAFQVIDAIAITRAGALNGTGQTRRVMRVNVLSAWLIQAPGGWLAAIGLGLGAPGAWAVLTLHLAIVAALLGRMWSRTSRTW